MTALGYTVHPVLNGTGGISEFKFAHLEEVKNIISKLKKEGFIKMKFRNYKFYSKKGPERRK